MHARPASENADVVVVGAGIIGATLAYLLAVEGFDVILLEKESVGRGATGHGHGIISLIGKDFRPGAHLALGALSAAMYKEFCARVQEDGGIDPMYHELPAINFAVVEEEAQIFREFLGREDAKALVDAHWVGVDECRDVEPLLTEDAIGGVIHTHGQVDAYKLALAAVAAFERHGGRMRTGEAVGLARTGDRVTGVEHRRGRIDCEHVVLAAGAWMGEATDWLGFPVPVRPLHGEVLLTRLAGDPVRAFILTGRHGPILPRKDGVLLVGSIGGVTMSGMDVEAKHVFDPHDPTPPRFDEAPTQAGLDTMIERAVRVMPALRDAELVMHLAGVRPLSADRMPLIGPVPGVEGAWLATGHGTKGIHLAPVTAKMVTDYVARGNTSPEIPAEAFLPERFAEVRRDPEDEP
jgi:glycine oxidase